MRADKQLKRIVILVLMGFTAIGFGGCQTNGSTNANQEADGKEVTVLPNTPIITDIFTADPSAHVFDGQLYIYPSHDPDELTDPNASSDEGGQYQMTDYHVLSIDSFSGTCTDHGVALSLADIPWAGQQLWAPDAAYKKGKYFFYFPAKDKDGIFRIGVATSKNPAGPFTAEESYIAGSFSMDPCVFVDTDGAAYMFFGGLDGGQLEDWQTGAYVKDSAGPGKSEAALGPMVAKMSEDMLSFASAPTEIAIVDENGDPIMAGDENRRFFEASWVHKYNGKYYLSYSTGTTHFLVYAVSDTVTGPYVYKGQILEPVQGWTTHHSIVEFNGEWYLFYHDDSLSGLDYRRCVKYTKLTYNEDGTIQTIDPYADMAEEN